jgi:poly-gamma-glutamate capsule biosynthesis protein CapA/YwtB (metallophosphatase superfamily)
MMTPTLTLIITALTFAPIAAPSVTQHSASEQSADDEPGVTLAFTGDVLIHGGLSRVAAGYGQPYDFRPMLQPMSALISSADLAICHLEVPLSPDDSHLSSYPRFNAPRQVADALAYAGFDGCSTASNHAYDAGQNGVLGTIEVLTDADLGHAGTAVGSTTGWKATVYDLGRLRVAHIAATYWLNGLQLPDASPWLVQSLDVDEVLGVAAAARANGADLVVVSMHCCVEYRSTPTPAQEEMAHQLIDSPYVDLVVGHHSHVVGPVEKVGSEYILYGLGNFLSGQRQTPYLSDGVIVFATARPERGRWVFTGVEAVPTYVERGTFKVRRAEPGSDSYHRTMSALGAMGEPVPEYRQPSTLYESGRLI